MIEDRFLRRSDVEAATGLSRATIYRLMSAGEFVRPYRMGKNSVRWLQSEVQGWMNDRPKSRGFWLLNIMSTTSTKFN
ncbi:helix-turn-helix transcriptional regulator [Sphingobium sp.]|uniref:helix-turn-helix transcriptional regulator n=1 Tax=Sphingobium sp. TaxID=1912891 RepID=UPI003BB57B60